MKQTTEDTTIMAVAKELAHAFTSDKRPDGETFYKLADDAPEWCKRDNESGESLMLRVHRAVDDRMPDDWIYSAADSIASSLCEYDCDSIDAMRDNVSEIADGLVDVYNADLTKWLASHLFNISLCDEAAEELGYDKDKGVIGLIQLGQFKALESIAHALIGEIEAEAERREELSGGTV